MRTTGKVMALFDELIGAGEQIKKTCKRLYFAGNKRTIDPEEFERWRTSCLSLLKSTFGSSSPHYDSFANLKFFDHYNSTQIYLGILRGARDDLEKGYFFHKDLMLSVAIYDSLLNRAGRHLEAGHTGPAAVLMETVLAEILAKIADNRHLPHPAQDDIPLLASRLHEAGVFKEGVQERLLSVAGLLGTATDGAGRTEELGEALSWIAAFLNDYLASQIMILN